MKLLGKIFYGLFITLLVAVAGLLLVSLVPITGNVEIKIVKSGSMAPSVPVGSVVAVWPAANYQVGDIVTFGRDTARDIPTTHRIVGMRVENGVTLFQTKGDANEEADPQETTLRDVIGKVFLVVPYAGFVLDFARQPVGFALLIGVPAAMIIIDESVNIFKEAMALRRRRKGDVLVMARPRLDMKVPQKPQVFRERIPTI
ncbi:MAG: signal peptidase I [Candidatus Adlerbacteria bacterium]|nr:signal peptidase I [Candidatus Adlerbacteria bacterium]